MKVISLVSKEPDRSRCLHACEVHQKKETKILRGFAELKRWIQLPKSKDIDYIANDLSFPTCFSLRRARASAAFLACMEAPHRGARFPRRAILPVGILPSDRLGEKAEAMGMMAAARSSMLVRMILDWQKRRAVSAIQCLVCSELFHHQSSLRSYCADASIVIAVFRPFQMS